MVGEDGGAVPAVAASAEVSALRILVIALVVIVLGGVGFLAFWEIPPTRTHVEITIPNERFQQ